MRAGLSTIQQTLTPEAAAVLTSSMAEASRRSHSQTTPLHVAATLLAAPSGFLRQACVRSHPNSSHPLQSRALELCFSVALERLPATAGAVAGGLETGQPPVSNALMAALKRAQASQRRGCPEQQQQPLLAVKVELEQLIISILDDPSVSRVMKEASFSSPAVKATIEQSLASRPPPTGGGLGFRPSPAPPINRNMYLNPRLQQVHSVRSGPPGNEEMKQITNIFSRLKKRNPILVGENEPQALMIELRTKLENGEFSDLKNIEVIQLEKDIVLDKARLVNKIRELCALIEARVGNSRGGGGVVLDLGDLKWLAEAQPPAGAGRAVVDEVAKVVARFGDGGNGRIWLIGTATCETYMRCQIYYPSMENDWDVQAVPIAPRSPSPCIFPRLGDSGVNGSVESLSPMRTFQSTNVAPRRAPESLESTRTSSHCPQCTENYEKELAKLVADEYEKSSSEVRSEPDRPPLPQWLQNAKSDNGRAMSLDQSKTKDQEMAFKQKTQELQKKWNDTCLELHPNFHSSLGAQRAGPPTTLQNPKLNNLGSQRAGPPMTLYNPKLNDPGSQRAGPPMNLYNPKLIDLGSQRGGPPMTLYNPKLNDLGSQRAGPPMNLYNPKLLLDQPLQQKLQPNKAVGVSLQLNSCPMINKPVEKLNSPPRSPVRTDLVLGRPKITEPSLENTEGDRVKDLLGCISSEFQVEKFAKASDTDSYKKLLKGLMEKVWWQKDAASVVASTVTKCNAGEGKRGTLSKGETWLLFTGPDRIGKKKMASVISEHICGSNPTMICLGRRRSDEEVAMNFRGKTVLDRIVDAVRRNPCSVIMLEDIDEASILVRGSIKRAMESGRLTDSYGREISLGTVVFILTANWLPENLRKLSSDQVLDEDKLGSILSGGWQLRISVSEKRAKRRADWLHDGDRVIKRRKELGAGLSLDLNLMADSDDNRTDGSHNSSDLTADQDDDQIRRFSITSVPIELANFIDDAVVFKPVEIVSACNELRNKISEKFSNITEDISLEVEEEALEKILGGVWLGRTSFEEWGEKVLIPTFHRIKTFLPSVTSSDENTVVRLEIDSDSGSRSLGDWLPSSIRVGV